MKPQLPDDFTPENSDVMSPEEEYELIQILAILYPDDDFIDAPRPERAHTEVAE